MEPAPSRQLHIELKGSPATRSLNPLWWRLSSKPYSCPMTLQSTGCTWKHLQCSFKGKANRNSLTMRRISKPAFRNAHFWMGGKKKGQELQKDWELLGPRRVATSLCPTPPACSTVQICPSYYNVCPTVDVKSVLEGDDLPFFEKEKNGRWVMVEERI